MKITVVGIGYVGLSLSVLLAQNHTVCALDIKQENVEMLNSRQSYIADIKIQNYLQTKCLDLFATTLPKTAYENADVIIICAPTNYDSNSNFFDVSSIESIMEDISFYNSKAVVVIRSTVPVGYTESVSMRFPKLQILFSPEFLRENHALQDNLHPARIIVSYPSFRNNLRDKAELFAQLLSENCLQTDVSKFIIHSTEAEAVKLFSNTYLAMRVAFFNELDTYAEVKGLNSEEIIRGVCTDSRIGMYYNNPSFGYGGYCLPKDTKQLLSNFDNIPSTMIGAVVSANKIRKEFIAQQIICKISSFQNPIVGFYRLNMKSNSDNFRESSIRNVMEAVQNAGIQIVVYEPTLKNNYFDGAIVIHRLEKFKNMCNLIVANRFHKELNDVKEKLYTRDIFQKN